MRASSVYPACGALLAGLPPPRAPAPVPPVPGIREENRTRMRPPALLYGLYERKLSRDLESAQVPKHVGVMLDGNRRWARAVGLDAAHGHRAGAQRIHDLLTWCAEAGVSVVTMWMLSTDNLRR